MAKRDDPEHCFSELCDGEEDCECECVDCEEARDEEDGDEI